MDVESKIWGYSQTGTKLHAFKDGVALCNRGIVRVTKPTWDFSETEGHASKRCKNCDGRFTQVLVYAETVRDLYEQNHAEALKMHAEREAEQAPVQERTSVRTHHYNALGGQKFIAGRGWVNHCRVCQSPEGEGDHFYNKENAEQVTAPRQWALAVNGWELHIVRDNKALCERPVSSVRLTDREADNKVAIHKHARKCFGCTDIYQKENDMPSLDQRVTTGPLTPRQGKILGAVAAGRSHQDIAQELGLSRTAVSEDVRVIVAKMKAPNTAHAICSYGQYLAYMDAAQALSDGLVPQPIDAAEVHVNHVLEDLAQILRTTAERMLP